MLKSKAAALVLALANVTGVGARPPLGYVQIKLRPMQNLHDDKKAIEAAKQKRERKKFNNRLHLSRMERLARWDKAKKGLDIGPVPWVLEGEQK